MAFNQRYLIFSLFILVAVYLSSTNAIFCSNLTANDDKDTPCFLESPTHNPGRLRSSSNSLILPCHVARSKSATIEWWYQDFQKLVNIKIYPVFPAVRPTALRFITSASPTSKHANETDIMDLSILLRHINVDDSGFYRCVIRSRTSDNMRNMEDIIDEDNFNYLPSLTYHVELTGPRLCQTSLGSLPCFQSMRTSSPTIIDAYQTAFLQCVVHNHNRPVTVFWVVGSASANNVLITEHLTTNQHNGDRLRRIFPLSPFDYSIELTVSNNTRERTYSCVIDGAANIETTLFTYVVRSIDLEQIADKTTISPKNESVTIDESQTEKPLKKINKIISHDDLSPQEIDELREKSLHEHPKKKDDDSNENDDLSELHRHEKTSKTI